MSTVIKAGQSANMQTHLSTLDLTDHLAEVTAAVSAAKREASRILADSRNQSDQVLREAKTQGFDAGYGEGRLAGEEGGKENAYADAMARFQKEHAHLVSAMENALSQFDELKQQIRLDAVHDVLELAIGIATKLTYAIGRLDREAAQGNLQRAIELVGTKTDLTVSVNPRDHEAMVSFANGLIQKIRSSSSVEMVCDDGIAPGGCRVANDDTSIDATLETQLDEMVSLLLGSERRSD